MKRFFLKFAFAAVLGSLGQEASANSYVFCSKAQGVDWKWATYGENDLPKPLENMNGWLYLSGKREGSSKEDRQYYTQYNFIPQNPRKLNFFEFNDEEQVDALCQTIVDRCQAEFGEEYDRVGVDKGSSFPLPTWASIFFVYPDPVQQDSQYKYLTGKYCNSWDNNKLEAPYRVRVKAKRSSGKY